MKIKILQLLDIGKQKSILELGTVRGKVVITKSTNKVFEQEVKKLEAIDMDGNGYNITDGDRFLSALLFHYSSPYLLAVRN